MTNDTGQQPESSTIPETADQGRGDTAPAPSAHEVTDLTALARDLADRAHEDPHGRASSIVLRGPRQRAVFMALTAGSALGEHASPPAASLQVLSGRVRLHSASQEWVLAAGQLVAVPPDRHAVSAVEDSVILLTVSLDPPD